MTGSPLRAALPAARSRKLTRRSMNPRGLCKVRETVLLMAVSQRFQGDRDRPSDWYSYGIPNAKKEARFSHGSCALFAMRNPSRFSGTKKSGRLRGSRFRIQSQGAGGGYSAACLTTGSSAPEARILASSSASKPSTSVRISSVCSPSRGERTTSLGLSDNLIGLPTVK